MVGADPGDSRKEVVIASQAQDRACGCTACGSGHPVKEMAHGVVTSGAPCVRVYVAQVHRRCITCPGDIEPVSVLGDAQVKSAVSVATRGRVECV